MKNLLSLFVLLTLVACAGGETPEAEISAPPEPEVRTDNLICPQVAILKAAEERFDYGGERPEAAQLVAKALMKKISGDCAYRKDGDETGIDISFDLEAVAARGPRLGGNRVSLPYFIAVMNPADDVLNRQIVTAEFIFSSGEGLSEIKEPLRVFIPMPAQALPSGPAYRVLVGFMQ